MTFAFEISPEDSTVRRGPRPGRCNLRGVVIDRHVWEGDRCSRCGVTRKEGYVGNEISSTDRGPVGKEHTGPLPPTD
jgi:hypothetical protein